MTMQPILFSLSVAVFLLTLVAYWVNISRSR